MDQLVVLQEILESFAKGREVLYNISPKSIDGQNADLVGQLLEGSKKGEVDAGLCLRLVEGLCDVYELKRLGDICRQAGHFDIAIRSYNKALSTAQDQSVRPVLLNNLGQVYARQGDLGRATVYYRKAVDGFEAAGDVSSMAHVLGNLGSAYRRGYDWQKAVENCYKSLKAFEEQKDGFGMAQMTGSLGRVYADMGERDLALLYYERSLRDFEALGDRRSAGWVLERLGRIKAEAKSWDDSARFFNKSLSTFDELGLTQSSGMVLASMGRMYLDKGDLLLAREDLERSLKQLGRGMQPAYQNAVASLAATYSGLAKQYLRDAYDGQDKPSADSLKLASQYFAKASDRYTELSSLPRAGLPEIRAAAGIARSMSYISRLQGDVRADEAASLAERAASSLDGAAANSEGKDRARIEYAQKVISGMKGMWSSGISSDPSKASAALTASAENMLSCAQGVSRISDQAEAFERLCQGIEHLKSGVGKPLQSGDLSSCIKSAASGFEGARASFASAKRNHLARRINALADRVGSMATDASSQSSSQSLRPALILLGWSLAEAALSEADRSVGIYTWDESMKLVEGREPGAKRMFQAANKEVIDLDEIEAEIDSVQCGQAASTLVPAVSEAYLPAVVVKAEDGEKLGSRSENRNSGAKPPLDEEFEFLSYDDYRGDLIVEADDFDEGARARRSGIADSVARAAGDLIPKISLNELLESADSVSLAAVKVTAAVVLILLLVDAVLYLI